MEPDCEVWTRKRCGVYNCVGGYIENDRPRHTKKVKCGYCNEGGYIEEWKDLRTLIRQMIYI